MLPCPMLPVQNDTWLEGNQSSLKMAISGTLVRFFTLHKLISATVAPEVSELLCEPQQCTGRDSPCLQQPMVQVNKANYR